MTTILVLDDDPYVPLLIETIVPQEWIVRDAPNGLVGLDLLRQLSTTSTGIDMIILDMQMPALDGYDLDVRALICATVGAGHTGRPRLHRPWARNLMQTVLYLDIDPTTLANLLRALSMHGEVLAIRADQDVPLTGSAAGIGDEAAVRILLTAHGLTPRQCDLVVLDVQGRSRADIAERCGISPATVKKYWATIYRRLGVESRPMLRAWVQAQLARAPVAPFLEQVVGVGL